MWLIYALGGGWGHLTRAVALASIAQRERRVRVLTNSPYASIVGRALPALDLVCAPPQETRRAVQREIVECRPSCLIVDTFPRGIGGELADVLPALDTRKVLVHRDLNPRYVASAGLRTFVEDHYDLVLVPGAGEGSQLGDLPGAITTDPWLVRSADQMPDRSECAERPVLVCASGKKEELDWYCAVFHAIRKLDRSVKVRLIAAERPAGCPEECWVCYWPAMDLFACAGVVVGGAGYNTVHECAAMGVPLVARPWPRTYDRQELRARNAGATIVLAPEEATRAALQQFGGPRSGVPRFANGAAEAVRRIAAGTA